MSDKPPTFEDNLKQLENLVAQLERTEMPLDKALQAFEAGTKLVAECKKQLEQAEIKVEKVMARTGATAPLELE